MRLRALFAGLVSLIFATAAFATATPPTANYSLPSIAQMKLQNLLSKTSLHIDSYYGDGLGGGGDFKYFPGGCSEDGGHIIKDGAGNCFLRTDLDGSVQQYGVTAGSQYDWITHHASATDITPVLNSMTTAIEAVGLNKINLSGMTVYMQTDYSIPSGVGLSCGVPVGPVANNAWYNDMPGAIYKKHGVNFTTTGRVLSFGNCFLFPDDVTAANTPVDAATTRAVLDRMVSNADTGFLCQSQGCDLHDLFIAGFDNPIHITAAAANSMSDIYLDGNVGAWINHTGGAANWDRVTVFDYLTKNSIKKQLRYHITTVANDGSGHCKLTLTVEGTDPDDATLADLTSANYIWVSSLSDGPSGCEGRWTPSSVDTVAGTLVLTGSAVLGPETYCHWAANSYVIYCTDQTNIANGQTITGHAAASLAANGIPDSTKVTTSWRLPPQRSYITDTGGAANTYVANDDPTIQPCVLADVLNVAFDAIHTNTGASTLNITLNADTADGCGNTTTGPIAIVHQDGTALIANDIISGAHVLVRYSLALTKWVLIQPRVVLAVKTTLAQATNIQVVFNGATCSGGGCGVDPEAIVDFTARIDAGGSPAGLSVGGTGHATGILVGGPVPKELAVPDRVAGLQCHGCAVFNHSIFEDVWNSNETSFTDLGNDSEGNTDDPYTVNALVRGESNNVHIIGKKFVKAGAGTLLVNVTYPNSPDRGCVTLSAAGFAATAAFDPVLVAEQGCVTVDGSVTNTTGVNLISNFMNFVGMNNAYQPNVTNYYEGAAAIAATDTTGSKILSGQNYGFAGAGVQTNTSTNLLDTTGGRTKYTTISANTTYINSDCGTYIYGDATAQRTATLPSAPPTDCTFAFEPVLFDIIINANGLNIRLPGFGQHDLTDIRYPYTNKLGFVTLKWNGFRWGLADHSIDSYEGINPLNDQTLYHGQTYFSYDAGNTRFQLCQKNGPGGILLQGAQMHSTPSLCLFFGNAFTTSSVLNYFYVTDQGDVAISTAADNGLGSHLVRLTTASISANVGDQVALDCHSINGTVEALGWQVGTLIDSTHVDLVGVPFVHAFTASASAGCRVWYLLAATTAPTVFNGVAVETGVQANSLVGKADIGGAHAVNSTKSWFNGTYDVTGAVKSDGAGWFSQAAASDLSNGVTGSGSVVLAAAPTITGTLTTTGHHASSGTALGCGDLVFGTGAGTSPTCTSVTGDDSKFRVLFTTGTGPAGTAIVFTLTWKAAYGTAPVCPLEAENTLAAAKMNVAYGTPATGTYVMSAAAVGLTASSAYQFSVGPCVQ